MFYICFGCFLFQNTTTTAWSGTPESLQPPAQWLCEAAGLCRTWSVNYHVTTPPETAARGKPCFVPALCSSHTQLQAPTSTKLALVFSPLNRAVTRVEDAACASARKPCASLAGLAQECSSSKLRYKNNPWRVSFQATHKARSFSQIGYETAFESTPDCLQNIRKN